MTVKVMKDDLADVLKAVHALVSREVLVGIPQADDARKEGGPIGNAEIGYIQEFGSPINNIPARPALVPGVEKALPAAIKQLKRGGEKALSGDKAAGDVALNAAGLIAQNSVRALITDGISPPLAESTLKARRRRGRTGTTPLLDTGQYRNAMTYVIRKVK